MDSARKCPPNQATAVFRFHLDLNSNRFRDAVGGFENNLVVVDGQYDVGPEPDIFRRRLVLVRVGNLEAFEQHRRDLASTDIRRMPGPDDLRDGEVWSTKGRSRRLGAMEAAEWGNCRWDPAAKPGAQFLDLDYQRLIFSLEFVAQMVIADHRRGFS
jgi:hypothetical protein